MKLNYAGTITKQQYLDVFLLVQSDRFKFSRWFFGILLAAMIIGGIIVVIEQSLPLEAIMQYASGGIFLLVILTSPWWALYLQRNAYGRFYDNHKDLFSNMFGVVDETGFTVNNREIQAHHPWSAITDLKMGHDLLLLRQGKYRSHIFTPKFFSSSEDWEQFVSFSKEKVALNERLTSS
jgi:hypothetical protein